MDQLLELVEQTEKLLAETKKNLMKIKKMRIPRRLAEKIVSLGEGCDNLTEPFQHWKIKFVKLLVKLLCSTKLNQQFRYSDQYDQLWWKIISPNKVKNNYDVTMTLDKFMTYRDFDYQLLGFCKEIVDVIITSCQATRNHLKTKVDLMVALYEQLDRIVQSVRNTEK